MIDYLPELKKNSYDIKQLNTYLINVIGNELNNIINPCYMPKMISYWIDLKKYTGIDIKELNIFFEKLTLNLKLEAKKQKKTINFDIIKDKITCLIIIGILYYSRNNQIETANLFYMLLSIRFYGNLAHKHMRYCSEAHWKDALSKISMKHLFKLKEGPSNAVIYLSNIEFNKNVNILKSGNVDEIFFINMIYALRHRIAQSFRSFANKYYILQQSNTSGIKTATEDQPQEEMKMSDINTILDNAVNLICSYKQIDEKELNNAISVSNLRPDIAKQIINSIGQNKYSDKIKFILMLINRMNQFTTLCTTSSKQKLIKKIILNKHSVGTYYIKNEIIKFIDQLQLSELKTVNNLQVIILFLNYFINYISKRIC